MAAPNRAAASYTTNGGTTIGGRDMRAQATFIAELFQVTA